MSREGTRVKRPLWVRIAIWIGAAVLFAVVVLAVSVPIAGIGSEARIAEVANTSVSGGAGPDVAAFVARPTSDGRKPAVIMVHEFWGLNENIAEKAALLSEEGYVVVAPDVFRGSTTGWIPRAIYQVSSTPQSEIDEDLDATYDWLREQPDVDPERIAIVGFCFGGRTAMLYSMRNPRLSSTTVFYGNPTLDAEKLAALEGPVLGIFGGADDSIPLEDVRAFEAALEDAGVENEVVIFEGQPHAFIDSVESIESGGADGEAWALMVEFLDTSFERDPSTSQMRPGAPEEPMRWSQLLSLGLSHVLHGTH